jgi:hypothetical protein
MANFTIRDCAGVVHPIRLSTDSRYPVAMDGGSAGFMSRRPQPARDQEQGGGELPEQLDSDFALQCMREIVDRVADPEQRKQLSRGMAELMDSMTCETDNGQNTYQPRPGFVPNAGGKTSPELDMNRRPRGGGAQDAALAMDQAESSLAQRDPVLASYISRIKTYGY